MNIKELTAEIKAFRDERDWKQFHSPKEMAIAISIEANELLEHFLWKTPEQVEKHVVVNNEAVREEIADVAIYILEMADNLGINLAAAVREKLAKNAMKYPVAKAKGSIRKYTEL